MGNYNYGYDWDDEPFHKPSNDITKTKTKTQYIKPRDARQTEISQELMQRLGMWSLCNVSTQQYTEFGVLATKFRLYCNICNKFQLFDYGDFLDDFKFQPLLTKMEVFCLAHRHEAVQTTIQLKDSRLYLMPKANDAAPIPARRYRKDG